MGFSFNSTFEYKLIYIFRINDHEHKNCLKIGDATIYTSKDYTLLLPNSHDLNYAARERIDSYTSTAGIKYELLHTEIAVYKVNNKNSKHYGKIRAFRDYQVHEVLKRSGIKTKCFDTNKKQNEWFITDLTTAINAIKAVKDGRSSLNNSETSTHKNPIIFRPEQNEAINKTVARFKHDTKMLWNAKMRFGKTLSALQVAKKMNFKRTIIITHRPVVEDGWYEDFDKIFYDRPEYYFGSKTQGKKLSDLIEHDDSFIYFASMQDLRGSDAVGGNFDKNNEIFDISWDFVVVDEAHEGTKTSLGQNVLKTIIKEDTKDHKTYVLELSGTPFNLLTDFEQESIYTWDYIMEQEAKSEWDKTHFGDSNPYEELPRMNIFTYHLEKSLPVYIDVMDKAFNFKEFFRLWTGDINKDGKKIPSGAHIGDFVHEDHVKKFLDLICRKDDETNYPFSTETYRDYFRHSLWVVPGVREAKALSKLLKQHHIFKYFEIVNVAGEGDEEIDTSNALDAVKKAMTNEPNNTRTITLSCGRLTTGVSIPEWTAVLMLAGTYSTAASQYLQTIFRVQTPANINGKIKEECYVFDFAPDRTLKMVAESVQLSVRAGSSNPSAEKALMRFLNYCPVIAIEDSNMKEYKVSELLQELKKAYAERVARNGFDDPKIYNDELLKLTEVELKEFEGLKEIVGSSKQTKKVDNIDINKEGFTEAETEEEKKLKHKKKHELTEEEKRRLAELKEKRKNRDAAISILRAISIRMPLLVYGMDIDIDSDVTIDNFADLVDDVSWDEFMPKGVTKHIFKQFSKYYDKDIFVAASRRIRYIAKTADELEPTERVMKIASLFATFKNPDKETVLTPWRVVNMHLSSTIGGWDLFDEKHENQLTEGPRFVNQDNVTNDVFNKDSNILEINSKTGLYPLYVTYTLYRQQLSDIKATFEDKYKLWDDVVKNQVFVICKTPMAKLITKRTLLGYRKGKVNMHAFDDLIMQLKEKQEKFIEKILSKSFWNIGGSGKMKFNVVVGNPPYQLVLEGNKMSLNVYQEFIKASIKISDKYTTLITPAKWMGGELGPYKEMKGFFSEFTNGNHLRLIHDYPLSSDLFSGVDIKGGVSYFLYDKTFNDKLTFILHDKDGVHSDKRFIDKNDTTIIRFPQLLGIINKVNNFNDDTVFMNTIVSSRNPYGYISDLFDKNKNNIRLSNDKLQIDDVLIYGLEKSKRTYKYISKNDIIKDTGGLNIYKVFVPRANGSGAFGEKFSTPMLGTPMQICTDTFLEVGPFEDEYSAASCLKYIKTKFFRALVGAKKTGVFNYKDAFIYVPVQDFTKNSDIDWSNSIHDIDLQLFSKYKLVDEEIKFIEEKVQEMK